MRTLISVICPNQNCNKKFSVPPFRLKRPTPPSCCASCARAYLKARGYRPFHALPDDSLLKIKDMYETSRISILDIARRSGLNRASIHRIAKRNGWVRPKRVYRKNRSLYRRVASEKIGRALTPYEHVHHIDLDVENNSPDNLHVYSCARDHTLAHKSLERCAAKLIKVGHVIFNKDTGTYDISNEGACPESN